MAELQSIHRFFRYYALLVVYFVARQLAARGRPEPRLPQSVLLNYAVPLAIVAWANRTREPSRQRYGLALSEPRQVLLHSTAGAALASAFVLGPAGKRMLGVRDEWEQSFRSIPPWKRLFCWG